MVGSLPDIDGRSLDDLKKLVFQLLEENTALRAETAALRDEIAALKGLKGRPTLKPSGMETKTEKKARQGHGRARRRCAKNARLSIDEDRIIKAEVPARTAMDASAAQLYRSDRCWRGGLR